MEDVFTLSIRTDFSFIGGRWPFYHRLIYYLAYTIWAAIPQLRSSKLPMKRFTDTMRIPSLFVILWHERGTEGLQNSTHFGTGLSTNFGDYHQWFPLQMILIRIYWEWCGRKISSSTIVLLYAWKCIHISHNWNALTLGIGNESATIVSILKQTGVIYRQPVAKFLTHWHHSSPAWPNAGI